MPWVDTFGKSHAFFWEDPDTLEKYHHVQNEDYKRYRLEQELKICWDFWLTKASSAKFFKGTFFDYWRFWKTRSECTTCLRLFKPTRTAESYLSKTKTSKYTNYNYNRRV